MDKNKIIRIMNKEMVIALGCTDPIAISYAASAAKKLIRKGDIESISIYLSKSIIKSAASVIIPGTNESGIKMAAVLGALFGDSDKKLEVLEGINENHVKIAKNFLRSKECIVSEVNNDIMLYLEVVIKTSKDTSRVILIDDYSNWVYAELNKKIVFDKRTNNKIKDANEIDSSLSLKEIWDFITLADINDGFEVVKKSILLNESIANEGLIHEYGLQVGKTLKDRIENEQFIKDMTNYAVSLTAAGTDARMAGVPMPVMSNTGSGNQGITATMPVVATAKVLNVDNEKRLRAVALSNLITIYAKEYFGRISALCGVTIAATGASCGVTYLLGGGFKEIESAIQNMAGNITGMFCDGAKAGCALKVSTSVQSAMQAAYLAIKGINIKETDGIIEHNVDDTLKNIGKISTECSYLINDMIVDIMMHKKKDS